MKRALRKNAMQQDASCLLNLVNTMRNGSTEKYTHLLKKCGIKTTLPVRYTLKLVQSKNIPTHEDCYNVLKQYRDDVTSGVCTKYIVDKHEVVVDNFYNAIQYAYALVRSGEINPDKPNFSRISRKFKCANPVAEYIKPLLRGFNPPTKEQCREVLDKDYVREYNLCANKKKQQVLGERCEMKTKPILTQEVKPTHTLTDAELIKREIEAPMPTLAAFTDKQLIEELKRRYSRDGLCTIKITRTVEEEF